MTKIILNIDRTAPGSYKRILGFSKSVAHIDLNNPSLVDMSVLLESAEQFMTTEDETPIDEALEQATFDEVVEAFRAISEGAVPN